MEKDHCSGFFEKWPQWDGIKWKMFDLSTCCEIHDDEEDPQGGCASTEFIKCLVKNKVVGGILIFGVASIACWIKYPFKMIKRV